MVVIYTRTGIGLYTLVCPQARMVSALFKQFQAAGKGWDQLGRATGTRRQSRRRAR